MLTRRQFLAYTAVAFTVELWPASGKRRPRRRRVGYQQGYQHGYQPIT